MTQMLSMFTKFLADDQAGDMYVTGPAGSGKTTDLAKCIEYCIENDVPYVVCAYTHKACGVLRSKLPEGANIQTLHAHIKKRPMINGDATEVAHVQRNIKSAASDKVAVCFIDEYSTVGERDLMDLRSEQDDPETGEVAVKFVWLGDKNQLPPVGDMEAVSPYGKYQIKLTHIYRQKGDNELTDTLAQLVTFIEETAKPVALQPNKNFIRDIDLVETYKNTDDAVVLAFTNRKVEELNQLIEGKELPVKGDKLFSPTTKHYYTFIEWVEPHAVYQLDRPFGEPVCLGSKFKTLEYITDKGDYLFAKVHDQETDEDCTVALLFGHNTYKLYLEQLKLAAVQVNKEIETKHSVKAAEWSRSNSESSTARKRAKVWRDFLSFNECVICLDFAHAMTVHKSQGSTFKNVIVDTKDIGICADRNFKLYLRLLYVALSRASGKVYTN